MSHLHWPKRFRDQGGTDSRTARLASLFEACSEADDPSEDVIRRAARAALRSEPVESGPRERMQAWWEACSRKLLSRRMLAALALLLTLQLGLALGAEHGWSRLQQLQEGLRLWSGPRRTASAPMIKAPLSALATEPAALPLIERPAVEPLPEALIIEPPAPSVAASGHPTERSHRKIASPDPLATEAAMVSHAIGLLDANPRSSLSALDDYRRAFPAGALRGEAALAELRAHLALGESPAALAALDHLAADRFASTGGSASELRTSRLELMAGAGRCGEALGALDAEIETAASPRLQGRLLLVRASCRAAAGDTKGSQNDLRQYLRVLPQGPRAAEIRHRSNSGD